ncbi:hypothetical protein E4T42_06564 [Aureobasidium subglaciale]|nr:hypothetical protein E4T42_06564 [Aureobasidium subglaciale]
MLNSFPNIRVGLMVGIGGGAPTKHDIRLGDVVVSSPMDHTGGMYQYDYGKSIQGQSFQQTGFLDQPPAVVLTVISILESVYESDGHDIDERIINILRTKPKLRAKYSRPDSKEDLLYHANVVLMETVSTFAERSHPILSNVWKAVHYGIIASANQLMKDAWTRDTLARERNIMCFEMEAAGLMNRFPCLVVRGICDRSDSHKSKRWQGYAAMAAAAYAKDVLTRMVPSQVEATTKLQASLDLRK